MPSRPAGKKGAGRPKTAQLEGAIASQSLKCRRADVPGVCDGQVNSKAYLADALCTASKYLSCVSPAGPREVLLIRRNVEDDT